MEGDQPVVNAAPEVADEVRQPPPATASPSLLPPAPAAAPHRHRAPAAGLAPCLLQPAAAEPAAEPANGAEPAPAEVPAAAAEPDAAAAAEPEAAPAAIRLTVSGLLADCKDEDVKALFEQVGAGCWTVHTWRPCRRPAGRAPRVP